MSVKVMGAVWEFDLPANQLLILLALADHADHEGENIYPSIKLVAWKTGYSEKQARRIIQSLIKDGIVSSVQRPGQTSLYSIHLDKGKKKAPFNPKGNPSQIGSTPIAMSVHPSHSRGSTTPPIAVGAEPSLEPSVEPSLKDSGASAPVAQEGQSDGVKGDGVVVGKVMTIPIVGDTVITNDGYRAKISHILGNGSKFWLEGITHTWYRAEDLKIDELAPRNPTPTPDAGKATPANGAKAEPVTEKKPRARSAAQLDTDAKVLALAVAFYGSENYAKKDYGVIAKTANSLEESGILRDDFAGYVKWVRGYAKSSGDWTVTLTSLTTGGRMTDYLTRKKAAAPLDWDDDKPFLQHSTGPAT